ncbi:TetR/AcrR family transcriptional regulator [Rarobacter incanus]|uniref:TetR family transcriptional regulator n=1 Tax=Rarobacter incanus TaxID=153494 RepID=A0A542SQ38_9MICO|nr:TetR/AcrR family transcriptional regulator [Rarobacter incanus]TQK76733.1 TetR family transcriptional regulator [Rarobacter incanus]
MPKVSEEHRVERRDHVIEATLRLIVDQGVHRLSMADIIHESGLSAGSIYSHFASKDEILGAVVELSLMTATANLRELLAREPLPDPAEVIERLLPKFAGASGSVALIQVWGQAVVERQLGSIATTHVAQLREAFDQYAEYWLAEQGIARPGAGRELGALLLALSQAFTVQTAFGEPFEVDELKASIVRAAELFAAAERVGGHRG